jgi:hypothetical protein
MAFDLHISIQHNSEEAQAIQQVADAENVTQEQAARILLVEGAKFHGRKTPAQEMWGAFSSPEDIAMLDDIVTEAYALRLADQPRDLGI